jgi:hypothetical protein
MEKHLSVLRYPQDDKQLVTVIGVLNDFISDRSKGLKISINIRALPTFELNPTIHTLLQQLLSLLSKRYRCIDIHKVFDLFYIIQDPTDRKLDYIAYKYKEEKSLLKFFYSAQEAVLSIKEKHLFQFISLHNMNLEVGQGPYGVAGLTYPFSIAIETTGFKQSIYHEFLHQLNVSDGYGGSNLNTCGGPCWMQYDATKGKELCEKHSKELLEFIKRERLY